MEKDLLNAAVAGDVLTLSLLLEQDPLILDKASFNCEDKNPLHIAAILGHVEFVRAILQVNFSSCCCMCLARDRDGRNPLHLAAVYGKLRVLQVLIDANFQDAALEKADGGGTILHLCVKYNQLEALQMLVQKFPSPEFVNAKNEDGMTILHLALYYNRNLGTIEYLLRNNKVDVNAKNANGNTALDLFRGDTNSEIARSLETAGAKRAKEIDVSAAGDAPIEVEWLTKKRDALMVVAILIATMAFQAGVSPPGGVWQEDKESHKAGEAVMGSQYPDDYKKNFVANTVAFVSSLSIILLLISGLPFRRYKFFMWVLMAVMWLTITTIAFAYAMSLAMLVPDDGWDTFSNVTRIAVYVWCGVMGLLLLVNTIRLLNRWLKFCGIDLWKKIKQVAVREQTNDV